MTNKRAKHTHKYIKQQLSPYNRGWRCALDGCNHFLPKNIENTIEGRMSICDQCGEEFKLTAYSIEIDQPQCIECRPAIQMTGKPIEDVKEIEGMNEEKRKIFKQLGLIK